MTWTRLDDRWTDLSILGDLDHATRWHYLALIQFCSRTDRVDGVVRRVDALRCSDVPEAEEATRALVDVGLLVEADGGYRLPLIDDHIPPPSVRKAAEGAKQRKRRQRAHQAGQHADCLPTSCEDITRDVTRDVTRDTGTGQDGTGRDGTQERAPTEEGGAVREPEGARSTARTRAREPEPPRAVVGDAVEVPSSAASAVKRAEPYLPWGAEAEEVQRSSDALDGDDWPEPAPLGGGPRRGWEAP